MLWRDLDCAPHPGQKVGCPLSTVTVQACSRRSTLTTFKPAAGDHVIDVFIAPSCRIPSQGASRPAHHRERRTRRPGDAERWFGHDGRPRFDWSACIRRRIGNQCVRGDDHKLRNYDDGDWSSIHRSQGGHKWRHHPEWRLNRQERQRGPGRLRDLGRFSESHGDINHHQRERGSGAIRHRIRIDHGFRTYNQFVRNH